MTMTHAPGGARTLNDWEIGQVVEWVRSPLTSADDCLAHRVTAAISQVAHQPDGRYWNRGRSITAVLDAAAQVGGP